MRKLLWGSVVVVAALTACGSDSDPAGQDIAKEDRDEQAWEEAPADTDRPPIVAEGAVPYRLDYGQILWIEPTGVARMTGPTGECDDLMGDHTSDEWHDRYAEIPGFKGLVCNIPDPMNP